MPQTLCFVAPHKTTHSGHLPPRRKNYSTQSCSPWTKSFKIEGISCGIQIATIPGVMRGKEKERWQELCAQAAVEQDHHKLMALIAEIDRLLSEKERRLQNRTAPSENASDSSSAE